jgi:hypothetical protein
VKLEKEKRAVAGAPVRLVPRFVYRKATKPGTRGTGMLLGGRRKLRFMGE